MHHSRKAAEPKLLCCLLLKYQLMFQGYEAYPYHTCSTCTVLCISFKSFCQLYKVKLYKVLNPAKPKFFDT